MSFSSFLVIKFNFATVNGFYRVVKCHANLEPSDSGCIKANGVASRAFKRVVFFRESLRTAATQLCECAGKSELVGIDKGRTSLAFREIDLCACAGGEFHVPIREIVPEIVAE